jgi:hypothetical protein
MDQALSIRVRQHRGHMLITVAGEIDGGQPPIAGLQRSLVLAASSQNRL